MVLIKGISMSAKLIIALIVGCITWASSYTGISFALRSYSPGAMGLFRYLVAACCMTCVYLMLPKRRIPTIKELVSFLILGIIGFSYYNYALNTGELSVSPGITSFIISQTPIFTTIFAMFLLREIVRVRAWLGIGVSVFGIILIAIGSMAHTHFDLGILWVLTATISVSGYFVLQKPLLKKFHPIEVATFCMWGGVIGLIGFLPQAVHQAILSPLPETLAIIYLGVVPAAIGFACWTYVLSHLPANQMATFMYMIPFVALIIAWVFLGDVPETLSVMGGIVAILGAFIVNSSHRAQKKSNLVKTDD